jgi:threonine dehydrogenase-like Zn-dependent dehydrogenase
VSVAADSNGRKEHAPVRYLWIIAAVMVIAGVALIGTGALLGAGPIGVIAGVLLLWSGVIKVIVLRIWQKTLTLASPSDRTLEPPRARTAGKHLA